MEDAQSPASTVLITDRKTIQDAWLNPLITSAKAASAVFRNARGTH
ncbi:MAG: hypothetical protein QMD80_00040 [archaeon]|nr:hypothetical protein [archaeon]